MKINNPFVRLARKYIAREDAEKLNDLLSEIHAADLEKRLLSKLEPNIRQKFIEMLEPEILGELFGAMDSDDQVQVISLLDQDEMRALFSHAPTDDVVDFLGQMEEEEARGLLTLVEERREVERLLEFELDSAAGLMTTEYIAVNQKLTVRETIREIRSWAHQAETVYYIYVIDEDECLVGVLSLRELLAADADMRLDEVMKEGVVSVPEYTDQEEVAHMIAKYDLIALPVINQDRELVGIITVDDVMDVVEEETTEDVFKMAGLLEMAEVDAFRSARLIDSPVWTVVGIRLPWLLFALAGGLMAGGIIEQFEASLEAVLALAFFIPAVMDMGGNVGTQSSTIFVRGMALGHVDTSEFSKYLWQEVKVGISLGAISGLIVALVASLWQGSPALGVVVGVSMMVTVLVATVIGYAFPWLLNRFGFDPAAGSDPLITTVKDVTGLLIYFGMANFMFGHLI